MFQLENIKLKGGFITFNPSCTTYLKLEDCQIPNIQVLMWN